MADHPRAILLAPGDGTTIGNPLGGPLTFKLRGEETNGALAAFESIAPSGEGPPLHVHRNEDEIWYALAGSFRIKLDGEVRDAQPGTFAFIPRGVTHTWQSVGDEPGRLLVILAPAGLDRFFQRFAEATGYASAEEAFRGLGSEAGMDVVGPPLALSDPL
jgi:mannose-6-phosphate isomerase-like protein (cupin superfamily)